MNAELLDLLRCPKCRGPLDRDPSARALRCRGCAASYPVAGGVPRLAGEGYVASFGRQWNRYDVARDEEDEAVFAVKTGVDPRELDGKLVLDAGCGGGRYARLAGRFGAKVVGVDLERGRREGRGALRRPARRGDRPGRPARPAAGRGGVRPGLLDRRDAPQPRPAAGVRAGRRAGQARRPAGGLALPQEHAAPGVAELGARGPSRPGCPRGCWRRSASGSACSGACRC